MDTQITLKGLQVEMEVVVPAPEGWGVDVHTHPEWGEYTRNYFALEDHIAEMIEAGEVEVERVTDMCAGSESETPRFRIKL